MSLGQIIDYFRNELRNKLVRPTCQKQLTLWDHNCWIKSNHIHAHLTQFIRINIGEGAFQAAQKNNIQALVELIKNTEALWDKGLAGNNINNNGN